MSRRLQLAVLYLLVGVLVALMVFTMSLSFPNDGRPFSWNRTESVNA